MQGLLHLHFDLRWPLTLVCDLWLKVSMLHLWPHFSWLKVSMLHLWPHFSCNWSLYGKEMVKCNQFYICSQFYIYILTSDDLWPWYVTFDLINIWRFPLCIYSQSLVVIGHCIEKKWTKQKVYTKLLTDYTHTYYTDYTDTRSMQP